LRFKGSRFKGSRFKGSRFKVQGSKVQGSRFKGSKVQGSRVQGSRFQGSGFRVQGSSFKVQGFIVDGFVKSQIITKFWIPAFAGKTITQLVSNRYKIRHTRTKHVPAEAGSGYPGNKVTFYDFIQTSEPSYETTSY